MLLFPSCPNLKRKVISNASETCKYDPTSPAVPTWSWPVWWQLGTWATARLLPPRWEPVEIKIWISNCLNMDGSVDIPRFIWISWQENINTQSKVLIGSVSPMQIFVPCCCQKWALQGDNPDFRTLLETRGAVAAALGKVCLIVTDPDSDVDHFHHVSTVAAALRKVFL